MEEEAARVVPGRRILGGLCFLCSNKVGPGHIRHLDYGHVKLAEYDPQGKARGITESMRQIGDDLRQAGISVELSPDLVTARWQKLVWNIPYNGLSVILDANTAELMASAPARALAEALMREVAVDAAALGRVIEPRFIEKMLDDTARMTPYRASMKIDFDERRPMEVESIYGAPLRAAQSRRRGFPVARNPLPPALLPQRAGPRKRVGPAQEGRGRSAHGGRRCETGRGDRIIVNATVKTDPCPSLRGSASCRHSPAPGDIFVRAPAPAGSSPIHSRALCPCALARGRVLFCRINPGLRMRPAAMPQTTQAHAAKH